MAAPPPAVAKPLAGARYRSGRSGSSRRADAVHYGGSGGAKEGSHSRENRAATPASSPERGATPPRRTGGTSSTGKGQTAWGSRGVDSPCENCVEVGRGD